MGSSVQERTNANIIDLIVTVCIVYLFYSLHNLQYSICKSYTFFANYLSITITDVMITFYKQIRKKPNRCMNMTSNLKHVQKGYNVNLGAFRIDYLYQLTIWSLILATKSDIDNIELTLLINLLLF